MTSDEWLVIKPIPESMDDVFLAYQKQVITEIATAFRLSPEMVGGWKTNRIEGD